MELFLIEASDHAKLLAEFNAKISPESFDLVDIQEMHAHAHTIKGAASMVGFMNTSHVARFIEKILLEIKNENLKLTGEVYEFLGEAVSIVIKFIRNITLGELNEAIILKDIASKYELIIKQADK